MTDLKKIKEDSQETVQKMRKILIAGGSGFLGQVLIRHFTELKDEVFILTRGQGGERNGVKYLHWDGKTVDSWAEALEGADVLINLSGRTVNCRYNRKNKEEILNSRILSTRVLGEAVKACKEPVKVWLNASSATIYEESFHQANDEASGKIGKGFSVNICQKWEDEFNKANVPGVRKVCLRTSMVIGRGGPFLELMTKIVKFRLGGRQGSGEQFVSWLHEKDFTDIVEFLIQKSDAEGEYNLAAPEPLRNKNMMQLLREACGVKIGLPALTPMVHLGAFLMRTEAELPLKSRNVIPGRLLEAGYKFSFSNMEDALKDLIGR